MVICFVDRGNTVVVDLLFKRSGAQFNAVQQCVCVSLKEDHEVGLNNFWLEDLIELFDYSVSSCS